MAETADEIEVQIEGEGAEVGERSQVAPDGTRSSPGEVKIEVEPKPVVVQPEEGLEKLKKQLADERKRGDEERDRRIAAETSAREASERAAREQNKAQATELDLVTSAITSLTSANDALEEKYAAALASQDYAGAAKVNREMQGNEAKLLELNRGKTAMEKAPKVTPTQPADPVEAFAYNVQSNGYPKSAAWVRAHPEYVRDRAKNQKMLAAHQIAMAEGFAPDSPEYFMSIEDTLKINAPRREESNEDDPAAEAARASTTRQSRQASPPAAPVSRSGNGTGGANRHIITLTRDQIEAAKAMDMTPEEYAKQVVALRAEGKLN